MNRILRSLVLAAPLLAAPSLLAQEPPDSTRPADADSVIPLEPVTITVLRSPFELRAAPYAVSVRGIEALASGPGLAADEALRAVPGVQVDNRYNWALGERISVRGFGARAQFGVRGVKVLLDGIPATLPDGQTTLNHLDPASLGSVQVIRGPASSLYGNAAGGVIQLETAPPPAAGLRTELRVLAGSHGLRRVHGRAAGRSGALSYAAHAARLAYGGYRDHADARNAYAHATLSWTSGRDELRLVAHAVDYRARNPGSLSDSLLRADRTQAYRFNVVQRTGEEGRHGQLGASWTRSFDAGVLELAAYGLGRRIDNPIPPAIIDLERAAGGVRALWRGRTAAGMGEIRWTAGAELDVQRDDRRNFENEAGERGALTLDQLETVRALGLFVQAAAPAGRRFDLLAGVRYDRIAFRARDRLIGPADPDDSGRRTMDAVSPSAGIAFAATEALTLFANVATAFATPTTTELANRPDGAGGFNPGLEPQRTTAVEAGARGRVGGVVAWQLAAYRARVRDELIGFEVPDAPGRTFFRNAGSAVHRGVEAEANLALPGGFGARVAYAWTDARFESYRTEEATHDGNRIPGVAPHRLDAALTFRTPVGWAVELAARHASRTAVNDANTAWSPGYTVLDLRAGAPELRLGGVAAAPIAGVDNLLDQEYDASVVVNAFGGRYHEPAPGRAFFAGVALRFGEP